MSGFDPNTLQHAARVFRLPAKVTVKGRLSSITNAFVNGILPVIVPSSQEVAEALQVLGQDPTAILKCVYCSDPATEWDHLRPLIKYRKPTGFITEIQNLVPACGKCNQSKGNRDWRDWINSTARLSPKSRNKETESSARHLTAYENWRLPTCFNVEELLGSELWGRYWKHLEGLEERFDVIQKETREIEARLVAVMHKSNYPISHP